MIHRLIRGFGIALMGVLLSASLALAGNPSGTGQPNAGCGDEDASVFAPGFQTDGFEVAEEHYAGESDISLTHAGSDHAVSQYDVACYQLTLRAH